MTMKKLFISLAFTCLAIPAYAQHNTPAQANADYPVFYVLGGAGQSSLKGLPADIKGASFQAGGGFVLGKNWSVETTYTHYGDIQTSPTTETSLSGISFGFVGYANVGPKTALFVRADAISIKQEKVKGEIAPAVGLGIQHGFTHGFAARLQYQHAFYSNKSLSKDDLDISSLTLQGIKSF